MTSAHPRGGIPLAKRILDLVLTLPAMSSHQVDEYLKADRERWGALIRQHNISID